MNPVQREILVVDGDERTRTLIEQTLTEQGFTVTAVRDGDSALRRIEAKPFALVVAEIRLPGSLDGMTTLQYARAQQPGLKCLFTSEFAPAEQCRPRRLHRQAVSPAGTRGLRV